MKLKAIPQRETLSEVIMIRVTPTEKRDIANTAGSLNMELAPFIRTVVNNAVRLGVELVE